VYHNGDVMEMMMMMMMMMIWDGMKMGFVICLLALSMMKV